MADQAPAKTGGRFGWLKTIACTLFGIVSGAFVMYLTPLVDNLVKPAKPLANFGIEHQGLTVTFVNRSTGAVSGWWDFGDGTPLEPVDLKQNTISHTYSQPGSYTAKLSLSNLLNEQSERTVNVQIDATAARDPVIESLAAVPTSAEAYAPATFRVTAVVKNADLCIYDLGGKDAMKVITDPANAPVQMAMFWRPGTHTIRLLAVAGKKTVEQTQVVTVKPAPRGLATAVLTVTDQATQVDKLAVTETVGESFPANATANVAKIDRVLKARAGYTITDAKLLPVANPAARGLSLEVAKDRLSVHLTGELVRSVGPLGRKGPPPNLVLQVALTLQRQTPVSRAPIQVCANLGVPGTASIPLPPLPANWTNARRTVQIQLQDGDKVVWSQPQLPQGAAVMFQNPARACKLTATVVGDQIRVDLADARTGTAPAAN
jgi:PKD repeat protein